MSDQEEQAPVAETEAVVAPKPRARRAAAPAPAAPEVDEDRGVLTEVSAGISFYIRG